MPVANKAVNSKKQKNGQPKKAGGPHTDATAPISRDEKPLAKDGSRRGRLPGSKTKPQQLLEDAQKLIEEKFGIVNFHPVTYMLMVAADEDEDKNLRMAAAGKAAPYIAASLKAVELTGDDGGPVQVELTDAKARLAQMAGLDVDSEK